METTKVKIGYTTFILVMCCTIFLCLIGARNNLNLAKQEARIAENEPLDTKSLVEQYSYLISSPEAIQKGYKIFQVYCIACHGAEANGESPIARTLNPQPRNFMDPITRWSFSKEPVDVYETITEGSPGTAMKSYKQLLSVRQRWNLVHFINYLPGTKRHHTPISEKDIPEIAALISL